MGETTALIDRARAIKAAMEPVASERDSLLGSFDPEVREEIFNLVELAVGAGVDAGIAEVIRVATPALVNIGIELKAEPAPPPGS